LRNYVLIDESLRHFKGWIEVKCYDKRRRD
jgi:hypothetical protein